VASFVERNDSILYLVDNFINNQDKQALHRGVHVRLMINDYGTDGPSTGDIDPITFLYLNGAEIRYFTTLTFLHTKYIGKQQ